MKKAKIYYTSLPDEMLKEEKLTWFRENPLEKIAFERIIPDEKGNWLDLSDNDFDSHIPLISKDKTENTIFTFSTLGVSTNRDEWVYDFDENNLSNKMQFFIKTYNRLLKEKGNPENEDKIKWSRDLKKKFEQRKVIDYSKEKIINSLHRPFVRKKYYSEKILSDILTQNHFDIFSNNFKISNLNILFSGLASSKSFQVLAVTNLFGLDCLEKTNAVPLSTYDKNGNRQENITDWALGEFRRHYADATITKEAIFYYVYAVLHTPQYRAKYEQNLKRDFPRIPYYADFQYFSERGQALADLHIGYESVTPYPLELVEKTSLKTDYLPKPKLKANKENGEIELDELTLLRGIPSAAWAYKLGNRTALEWILDQYKASKPSDKTIAEHFNTYQFSDYKATVIDLLSRVCRVSVETVRIVGELDAKV